MKVLIIEDNQILARNISKYLEIKKIESDIFFDWMEWFMAFFKKNYDVIILDINLPWMNWIDICKQLREKWKDIYIIMLTSNTTTDDKVKWLNIWADDYLGKPFDYEELLARINSIIRRWLKNKWEKIKIWNIEIDISSRKVKKWNEIINLSNLEFELLKYLMQNQWKVIDRAKLYEKVWWEFDEFMLSRTVDVYIWYLRKKLWNDFIQTKKWYWYFIE